MKTLSRILAVALIAFWMHTQVSMAQEPADQPPKYRLELIYNNETHGIIFGIGESRFTSVSSLRKFIAGLPPGSTLEWARSCIITGNEPFSSEAELRHFSRFCRRKGIKLIIFPAG